MQRVDESRNGGEIALPVGEDFEIALAENPTTGYRWRRRGGEAPLVTVVSDDFDAGAAPGEPGRRRWRLRAVAEGVARLEFVQARSWEAPEAPGFVLTVKIGPA